MKTVPLSIIDNANVYEGRTHADALRETLEVACVADRLGYRRYWMAEHHNLRSTASTASAIVLARIASVTRTIRVGYGAALMQNYSPLALAEQWGTLESYFPGRIDVGLGRTTGADSATSRYLRRGLPSSIDEFSQNYEEFCALLSSSEPSRINAYPETDRKASIWILGSGYYGADFAAEHGLPYAFAGHFAPANASDAIKKYKDNFRPSDDLKQPYAIAAMNVTCAESHREAARLATTQQIYYARMALGDVRLLPEPMNTPHPPQAKSIESATVVGSPTQVADQLAMYVDYADADELMINTMIHDPRARLASVELTINAYAHAS